MIELNWDVFNHQSCLTQNLTVVARLCKKQTFKLNLIIFWPYKFLLVWVYQIEVAFFLGVLVHRVLTWLLAAGLRFRRLVAARVLHFHVVVLIVIYIYVTLVIVFLKQLQLIKLHNVMFIYFLNQALLFIAHRLVLGILAHFIVLLYHLNGLVNGLIHIVEVLDRRILFARAAQRLVGKLESFRFQSLFVVLEAELLLTAVLMHCVWVLTEMVGLVAHRWIENALRQVGLPLVEHLAD
jgi:hypothetical protein